MKQKTKKLQWSEELEEVVKTVDGLGKGMDRDIVETVTALHVNGIHTTASCVGHLSWGLPYPWVDVGILAPKNWGSPKKWWKDKRKTNLLRKKGRIEARRLLQLVDLFYQGRSVPYDVRLIVQSFGWDWRLRSAGGDMDRALYAKTLPKKYLGRAKKEMDTFTRFLQKRFFKSK